MPVEFLDGLFHKGKTDARNLFLQRLVENVLLVGKARKSVDILFFDADTCV